MLRIFGSFSSIAALGLCIAAIPQITHPSQATEVAPMPRPKPFDPLPTSTISALLAINKDRVLRGNYYNALTDTTLPLTGSVDKANQRAAWVVGDKKDTVYETGLGNLSQPETSMLVHFGKERTQQWTLVRLEAPEESK